MVSSIALLLFGAFAATPCENLKSVELKQATITAAEFVPEGAAPAAAAVALAVLEAAVRAALRPQLLRPAAGNDSSALPRSDGSQTDSRFLINMELWLPPARSWNGKFMGVGNGGFAGSIQGLANDMPQALRLGYATAGTDTGHQDQGGDWAIGHPEKMIDFGYRSTHEMTLKGKELVKIFYDQSAKYAYFKGCSTGGRMALMEAQRYPEDYDGIIAGSLANRHIHMWTAGVARSIELSRHPEENLAAEKATLVNQLVMNTCDTLKEGFLNNPRECKVDFSKLLCAAGKDDNTCLTAPQLKTVNTFYGGLKNSKGELIFSGQALGNPIRRPTRHEPVAWRHI